MSRGKIVHFAPRHSIEIGHPSCNWSIFISRDQLTSNIHMEDLRIEVEEIVNEQIDDLERGVS